MTHKSAAHLPSQIIVRVLAQRLRVALLVAALKLCACADLPADGAGKPVRAPITGGAVTQTCEWPTTVQLNECTGTLVHPQVVTTASHCGTNHQTAIFGETSSSPARSIPIEFCRRFDGHGDGTTRTDWAVCKLTEPVTDIPIIPILMGCETEILRPRQKVVIAGFGRTEANEGDTGTKRWVETTINRVDDGRGIQVGGMGKAPCFGDSGGPAFVKLPDGSWRVFGIDSTGTDDSCAAGDLMALIHRGVAWMEQKVELDITPCHDADGKWNPSAACQGFSMEPMTAGRAWTNGCAEPTLSPPAATCGAAFGVDGGEPSPPPDASPEDTAIDLELGPPEVAEDTGSASDGASDDVPEVGSPHIAEESGCGCRVHAPAGAHAHPTGRGLTLALLVSWAGLRRRRRRGAGTA